MATQQSTALESASGYGRRLRARLQRWRERRELAALSPHERDRILMDAGLQAAELASVLRSRGDAGELPAMLNRFGLDPQRIDPGVLRDMQRVCAVCTAKRECRRAVANGADTDACRRFCPNGDTLRALAS